MTRLKEDWIKDMEQDILKQQQDLVEKTGLNYAALAAAACRMSPAQMAEAAKNITVAAVHVTAGLGVIGHFAQSVAAIVRSMGFNVFVTEAADVNGIAEACEKGASVLFMADDDRFIALNRTNGLVSDNNLATVKGFVTALDAMAGGLSGKQVLVLGCGLLGNIAMPLLKRMGAEPVAFDTNSMALEAVAQQGFKVLDTMEDIKAFTTILDVTNTGEWLSSELLNENVKIAAPGVPLSLTQEALKQYNENIIHDLLPIGVAAMLGQVVKG